VRRHHNILKLKDTVRGDGQWRLRLGRFRFRYDIYDREVLLLYCGLRREDTYRDR
jgi:mRNA-degrading endonuclease RelE of RelBE toxin-antitoxin system